MQVNKADARDAGPVADVRRCSRETESSFRALSVLVAAGQAGVEEQRERGGLERGVGQLAAAQARPEQFQHPVAISASTLTQNTLRVAPTSNRACTSWW